MDDGPAILIVDSNEGFAAMLQQSLEQDGGYNATVAHDGKQALQAASDRAFAMAIVDLGVDVVDDLDGAALARSLRERQGDLRLMLIPLSGDALPEDLGDLDVQGTLPKPFFLPELPHRVEAAMTRPMGEGPAPFEPAEPQPPAELQLPAAIAEPLDAPRQPPISVGPPPLFSECPPPVMQEMENLARETNAAAVFLTRGEHVLGSAGRLHPDDVTVLARIVDRSWIFSCQVAEILRREQRDQYEQSLEGDQHMLYSLIVVEDVMLSAALGSDAALGILRHRVRSAARRIRDLMT
jgi:DNA-binding response OmpR family regulator